MTFRVVRTNQYNQDLGLIHSTNGNHLESPKEGSSIDHQVTIYLHAQNITMFPTNETWGSADKKGESGSRGLQKPANNQKEGSAVTPSFAQRVEMAQRRIVHTVLDADRDAMERDRERRRKEARSISFYSSKVSSWSFREISADGMRSAVERFE
ncbi:ATPase 6, plasma membrane-type-like [Dorcoceras hygrometricum]|uniref:ATPase 6, plasma membrane-type-like n=1 Tax=Dorcoceras hygrometricum TaxID=472368 RepID=A0A2Z7BCV5_9LAMI|nr:ATPase 6, plasma membrane-type-like [Dorcoceras hygrometricum]